MKRFSKLALPYVVWAALMLVLPMVLIALYSAKQRFLYGFNKYSRG